MTTGLLALALLAAAAFPPDPAPERRCYPAWVTGYVRHEFSPWTYDGTSIYTEEPIAASAWDLPLGSMVEIENIGTFRIADRGHLGNAGWIDVAVWSRAEAFALTGTRMICVTPPS